MLLCILHSKMNFDDYQESDEDYQQLPMPSTQQETNL